MITIFIISYYLFYHLVVAALAWSDFKLLPYESKPRCIMWKPEVYTPSILYVGLFFYFFFLNIEENGANHMILSLHSFLLAPVQDVGTHLQV